MNDYDRFPNINLLISVSSKHRIKFQVVLFFISLLLNISI